ncbi:DUF4227 family protein [Paenibacillus sp. sgz500958]|uniref:DUF4227 family protein n=1 Tax=Paenibacillus sp. sgz500958 TaxID=3242475 RepID=UPI0036D289A1
MHMVKDRDFCFRSQFSHVNLGGIHLVISIPKAVRRLYFIVMFVALSYLFYCGLGRLQSWISPMYDYGIPEGTAVKAYHEEMGGNSLNPEQRLRLYYWYGE